MLGVTKSSVEVVDSHFRVEGTIGGDSWDVFLMIHFIGWTNMNVRVPSFRGEEEFKVNQATDK
jgi:hypothetical protein